MRNQPASGILQVGGDPQWSGQLSALLAADGLACVVAQRAEEALQLLHRQPAELVLLDLDSPSGPELLQRLKEHPPAGLPLLLAFTGADDPAVKLRAFALGAVDCIAKQTATDLLRARLLAALKMRRRQDELVQNNQELIEARRLAESSVRAKADFLAAMSHEIRTPMNGVIAMVGLLMETPLTSEQRSYLETIQTSGESLLTIINDILDFSKIEAGKMELDNRPLDLRTRIEETLDLLATKAAEKNLDLAYQVDSGIPVHLEGDSLRLRQVLVNLLSNAVKFTDKGEVFVHAELLSARAPDAAGPVPLHLHFSVRDTGIGIKPEKLARLFKPFAQAEKSIERHYGGTGLGLVISKRIVEIMGGKMWAESLPGQGSTFHFTATFHADPRQPDGATPALTGRLPRLAGVRILIADDNATVRRVLAEQAAQWGMLPRAAETAAQALDWLRAGEPFDLVVVDAQMPGMDGLQLVAEIRKLPGTARLPVIFLMPMGKRPLAASPTPAAFAHSVTKPVKPALLYAAIESALFKKQKPAAPAPPKADQPLAERYPLRILLCEDNVINQKVTIRILQQIGYRCDLAANGREGLEACDRQPYDLIFMDMMMPEMDGLAATRAIRERQRDGVAHPHYRSRILIIAMTALAQQSDRESCLAAGMDDYLAKPIRPADVRNTIERWAPLIHAVAAPAPPAADTAAGAAKAGDLHSPDRQPPVDMSRLLDLTEGNPDSLRDLVAMFYRQTTQQLKQIEDAVRANQPAGVGHVAHSCKGACATLGMTRLAAVLLDLEKLGKSGALTGAEPLCAGAWREYKEIQAFFAGHSAFAGAPPAP